MTSTFTMKDAVSGRIVELHSPAAVLLEAAYWTKVGAQPLITITETGQIFNYGTWRESLADLRKILEQYA